MTKDLLKVKQKFSKGYGLDYVNVDGRKYNLDTVSFGSMMMDYKSGIGGAPYGYAIEIFGANKLGKSSAIGYPLLGNVQAQGKLPCVIASEPRLVTDRDREWARKMGFEPDEALILYPDNEEDAFAMLRDLAFEANPNLRVDYIMIDSLGGIGTSATAKKDGKTTKAYGISGAVTAVLNDIMPRLWRNNMGLMILNQQRQKGNFNGNTLYDSPGGEGLHHQMRMRIQLKPGGTPYMATIDGEKMPIGRPLTAKFVKNNMAEAGERSATFEFFHVETQQYGIGINKAADVANTAILTGVIESAGAWVRHDTFPGGKIQGKEAAGQYILENPDVYQQIRGEVLEEMMRKELKAQAEAREAEKFEMAAEVEEDDDE